MMDRNAFAKKETHRGESTEAFWGLWEAHQPHIFELCLSWVGGDPQEAHDLLSSAMLCAYDAREEAPTSGYRAWAIRIARNIFNGHERSRGRLPHAKSQEEARTMVPHPSIVQSPEQDLFRREQMQQLLEAFDLLPLRIRTPMLMRCLQDKPYREIARQIQVSDAHARKLVQKGRDRLRELLQLPLQVDPLAPARTEESLLSLLREEDIHTDYASRPNYAAWVLITYAEGQRHEELVMAQERPGRLDQKLQSLERYVARFPKGWKKRLELSEVLLLMGRRADAIAQLEDVLRRQPGRTFIRLALAQQMRLNGNGSAAIRILRAGLLYAERRGTILHLKGNIKYAEGNLPEAANLLKQACVMEPAERAHLVLLAKIALEQGATWSAWEHAREALKLDPHDIEAQHLAVLALKECGATALLFGMHHFLDASPIDSALAHAMWLKHLLLTQLELPNSEARRLLRQLGQAVGETTAWVEGKVLYAYQQHKDMKGLAILREYVSKPQASVEMLLLALRWATPFGDMPWAVQLAARLQRDFPDDPKVMREVLLHGYASRRWPQWAREAAEQWPQSPAILDALAEGWMQRGDSEASLRYATLCMQFHPACTSAGLIAARACKSLGLLDAARGHVRMVWTAPALAWSPLRAAECALLMADIEMLQAGNNAGIEWLELAARMAANAEDHYPAAALHYRSRALAALGDRMGAAHAQAKAISHGWRGMNIWP